MKVFLSSTAQDLDAYRKIAEGVILDLSQQIIGMEHFRALPGTPVEECERLARESDVLVCIVAHRYGSGITQLEVEAASKAGRDALVWIVADDHPWSEKKETDLLGDPNVFADPAKTEEVRQRVEALSNFKAWLRKTFTADTFTTPENLGRKIAVALANYVKGKTAPPVPQDKVSIARLPVTGSELFGRETELQMLDDAWADPNTKIVSFVAWGGVGKTALVNHWLKRRMARDNYRGADRVYGWSFFSQGTRERAASADLFIDQALRWFGDPDPAAGSSWDKGERLARYMRQSRTLLILDGLEPLQHPPGPQEGRVRDVALQALLVELAAQQPGLCVISTREQVGDLVEFENGSVVQHNLEQLSPQAGAQILRSLNVNGDDEELEEAARELGGHAFSLTLLGSYLDEVLSGDIRRRKEIENLFDDTRYGDAAQNMIAAYEKWLGEGMELAILRLLGLFDRPADLAIIEALGKPPAISGLTEPLQHFKGHEWNRAVSKLRRIKLLAEASPDSPGTLDSHPLVREHFKQQLKQERADAWREANNRIYEYLKHTTKELPDTIEEMSPLFAAVAHGCAAGKHLEVLNDIYFSRIQRGRDHFSTQKLGTNGANLAALACVFEVPWHKPAASLPDADKGYVLNEAGFCLRRTGRLREAAQPLQAALETFEALEHDSNAAGVATNLSELQLSLGNFAISLDLARQGLQLADRSDDTSMQIVLRTTVADVLHQAGRFEEAADLFIEAEELVKKFYPGHGILFSTWGFRYCDLLLGQQRVEEVKERAARSLELLKHNVDLVSVGLDNISLGRAWLIEATHGSVGAIEQAHHYLQQAMDAFRQAEDRTKLPRGLIARAELYRLVRDFEKAEQSLSGVRRIAESSGMALYLADYHLESARLRLAQNDKEKAREHSATAKEMINRMGYHRRDKEVAELEALLG